MTAEVQRVKRIGILVAVLLVVSMLLAIVGCSTETTTVSESDASVSSGATQCKVADVADDPAAWDNKVIVVEGNYAVGYCSACFLLKDGVSALRVEVTDTAPLPPESKLNSRMRVSGQIYVVNGSPNLIASKIDYL
jgi:uncharacterized protein YdeI (BOF family)